MDNHYKKTLRTLERFISPTGARALLTRSLKAQGISPAAMTRGDVIRMSNELRRGVRLFVDARKRDEADRELTLYCGGNDELPDPISLTIHGEYDIGRVRAAARKICTSCGANPFSMQKIATVVSELARNMVLYANGGELSMTPRVSETSQFSTASSKTRVVICASDQGPGIPNIEHILSGNYRSKTGLGRGLLGTKRLASSFDISTSSGGTTITAEIPL